MSHLTALELCITNYEEAMKLSQGKVKEAEKEVKRANQRFDKLVHLVKHNVKNPETILKQIGEIK
jgi:ppGpp synthetase/RelA/SpoT-type nucleotidyltranferase